MYEEFYGLTEKPFSLLPDASFLFLSKRHRRVINFLEYGDINQAGFVVISGDVGAGKTTVIRRYLKHLTPNVTVGLITNASRTLGRLLGWIAMAFELETPENADDAQLYNRFVDFLVKQYAKGKRTVLIIDEAQNMTMEMLEDLRMLSNINNDKDMLLQIILVGQPELLDLLKNPALKQFVQRITVHYHLGPLSAYETAAYIHHRLKVAGSRVELFDDTACAAVYYFTGGVPRLINLLCDQALTYAYADDLKGVSFQSVMEVALDRESGGLTAFQNIAANLGEKELQTRLQPIIEEIWAAADA